MSTVSIIGLVFIGVCILIGIGTWIYCLGWGKGYKECFTIYKGFNDSERIAHTKEADKYLTCRHVGHCEWQACENCKSYDKREEET